MRRGISIIEMLAVIFILGILLVPFARLTTATMYDVPRSYRVANVNTTVLNALEHIRKDVHRSIEVPASYKGRTAEKETLIIRVHEGVFCYVLEDDMLKKYILSDSGGGTWRQHEVWKIPKAVIDWNLLREDGRPYAVELHKYVALKSGSVIEKKFENSYIFFVGVYPEPVK